MNKEFISSDKNDSFAFLRGLDLQELLVQVKSYFLEYRDSLNLPSNVTFGVEIEYERILKITADRFIKKNLVEWTSEKDDSLKFGGEIKSPVMIDSIKHWQELKIICDYLTRKRADTTHNASGHIHIGSCILGNDVEAWKQFLKLYTAYEHVLFRFTYGDKISGRKKLLEYAFPIADKLYEQLNQIDNAKNSYDILKFMPTLVKYIALNLQNTNIANPNSRCEKNTIELRCPNATTNAVIWQNNINAFAKMLVSSKNKVMNEEFLDYKLKHEFYSYKGHEYLYNEINLKNALEFVDLIFDNNLDKIYFLRQYLKNFQENYGTKSAVRAEKFVRQRNQR